MAFASASMVATLVKDLKPVEGKITKLKAYAKDYDQSTLLVGIAGLDVPLVKCKPRIEKWERELKLKPPIFPDNDDYKSVRGELTKLIGQAEGLEKKMVAEKKIFDGAVTVKVVGAAKDEILGKDKALAQALSAVARGDKGRSSPKTDDLPALYHIHIGGNASDNLVFNPSKKLILGRIPFHMDKTMNDSKKAKVKKVCERSSGTFTALVLNKEDIVEDK